MEGGTRVPCIIRWPGTIPAGKESNQLIAAIDILPTLSHACGIDLKTVSKNSPVIDGVNVLDTLTGKADASHPRKDLLYWHGKTGFHAIRVGDNPGEHTIVFGLLGETIELTVRATNRDSYALGALAAAKYAANQGPGIYSMADVLGL